MTVTHEDLNQFQAFAKTVIAQSDERLTLDDLWDRWRLEHPTEAEFHANVQAIKSALQDVKNGDEGITVEQHLEEVRKKFDFLSG